MNKKVAITGASGLIGTILGKKLKEKGYKVFPISRSSSDKENARTWSIEKKTAEEGIFEDIDVIIHLSGEGIANKRWSEAQKKKIINSRVSSTRFLCELIRKTNKKPSLLICASGIGIYGDRKDTILDEQSSFEGDSFLKEVCIKWEEEASQANKLGLRVVSTRLGVVLSSQGGALKKMLLPFKLGVGGEVGSGEQYMSWISIEDAAAAFIHCIENDSIQGAVNLCSPSPVTNKLFTETLSKVLKRPHLFPLPAFMVKILLGQMGHELLLFSTRVLPKKLLESGFNFKDKDIEQALENTTKT